MIGSTAVLADGTIAHAGGMVVKNVAGYDMSRLYVGSFGTLAVLVQINLKTIAAQPVPACFTCVCPKVRETRALAQFEQLPIAPSAAFWIDGHRGSLDGDDGDEGRLSVLLEGSQSVVQRATRDLRSAMGRAGVPDTRIVDAGARESFERIARRLHRSARRAVDHLSHRGISRRRPARADACKTLAERFELRSDTIVDAMNGDLLFRVNDLDARAFGAKIEMFDDALHDTEPRATSSRGTTRTVLRSTSGASRPTVSSACAN